MNFSTPSGRAEPFSCFSHSFRELLFSDYVFGEGRRERLVPKHRPEVWSQGLVGISGFLLNAYAQNMVKGSTKKNLHHTDCETLLLRLLLCILLRGESLVKSPSCIQDLASPFLKRPVALHIIQSTLGRPSKPMCDQHWAATLSRWYQNAREQKKSFCESTFFVFKAAGPLTYASSKSAAAALGKCSKSKHMDQKGQIFKK